MAPIPNDLLDDALKNKATLPSWKYVFTRLQTSVDLAPKSLITYLSSPDQLTALSQPHQPFPPPSDESKQSFESKTAAINFDSTDPTGPLPPIKDLKEEALELSRKLRINELGALRIVIIEYQSRDSLALINSSTASAEDGNRGLFANYLKEKPTSEGEDTAEKALQRRIAIYLSERRYITKTVAFLIRATLLDKCAWKHIGQQLLEKINPVDVPVGIIQAVRKTLVEGGGDVPSWIAEIKDTDSAAASKLFEWEKQLLLECIHFIQLLFILLYRPIKPNGATVMAWFKLMKETFFLYHLHTFEYQNSLDIVTLTSYVKPLCSIISLTILSFHEIDRFLAIEFLGSRPVRASSGVAFSDDQFYLKSHNTIKLITETLEENALNPVASLVTFCWSMILRRISEYLVALGLELEAEEQRAIEDVGPGSPETPKSAMARPRERTTGNAPADFFNKVLREIYTESSQGLGIAAFFAKCAVVECKLFDLLVQILTSGGMDMHGVKSWSITQEEDGKRMKAVLAFLVRKATEVVPFGQHILAATLVVTEVSLGDAADKVNSSFGVDMTEDDPIETVNGLVFDERLTTLLSELGTVGISTNIASQFWNDKEALLRLLTPARSRFPYEPLPFLKLVRALATDGYRVYEFLSRIPTYTQVLPANFQGYDTGSVNGFDEDPAVIYLEEELCLFAPRRRSVYDDDNDFGGGGIILPPGIKGRVISESASAPIVVMWQYEYNAITFLGRILECALAGQPAGGTRVGAGLLDDSSHKDAVIEIIAIFTLLLQYTAASPSNSGNTSVNGPNDNPYHNMTTEIILREASDATAPNRGIVAIIFELLEEELQNASRGLTKDTEYVTTALHFMDALLSVAPHRVWPYLARSSLLDKHGNGGALMSISSGIDVTNAEYGFTIAALRLFDDLVEEGLRGSAAYAYATSSAPANGVTSNAVTLRRNDGMLAGVSGNAQGGILEGWTKWAADVLESYRGWRYASLMDKLNIGRRIANTFGKLLEYVYGVDDSPTLENKVTSVLSASASHLVKVFLKDGSNLLPIQPIIGALVDGITTPETSLFLKPLSNWIEHAAMIMRFATSLVRVRSYIGSSPSHLDTHLFAASPLIAKLYAVHDRLKLPAIDLLDSMIVASVAKSPANEKQEPEPPSLLGHLGNECATHFTQVLSNLDSPTHDIELEIHIWNLVSAIVSSKQQGMSILILRGETFGLEQRKDAIPLAREKSKNKSRSILKVALDELSEIPKLVPELTLAMLETVALTQNHWSLAMEDVGKHSKFLAALMGYMKDFSVEYAQSDDKTITTKKTNTIAISASIAQIFSMYLYSSRTSGSRIGDKSKGPEFITKLVSCLKYYFKNGVNLSGTNWLDGYNPSLHGNLAKNFEMKWPGLNLQKFKKTRLRRRKYGTEFFYDTKFADKILSYDAAWDPPNGKGYREEFGLANLNMSVFDSKVELLKAWKLLALELTNYIPLNRTLGEALIVVIESCLKTNSETWNLPAQILTLIISERAEFAFVLMRRLQEYISPGSYGISSGDEDDRYDIVLDFAWKSIRSQRFDFRRALSSGDVSYYRAYLKIIYMALLDKSKRKDPHPIETCYKVLDMLNLVVAQGFRDLALAAHTCPEQSSPPDIALVTGILQAAMNLKGIEVAHNNLALHIAENDCIRAAINLFSWAEQIANGTVPGTKTELRNSVMAFSTNKFLVDALADGLQGDPVYGELAVLFLLELSKVPIIAEQMATEGTLERLLNTSLAYRIRNMNMGLLNPIHYPRLHSIWHRGLLPISVNIALGIGPRVAEEVMSYLRFFGVLIGRMVEGWKRVVLGAVSSVASGATPSSTAGSSAPIPSSNITADINMVVTLPIIKEIEVIVLVTEILKSMGVSTGAEVAVAIDLGKNTTASSSSSATDMSKTKIIVASPPHPPPIPPGPMGSFMDVDNVVVAEKAYGSLIQSGVKLPHPPKTARGSSIYDALHYRPPFTLDKTAILEAVEYLLSHENYLASLVAPTNSEEEVEAYLPADEENISAGKKDEVVQQGLTKLTRRISEEMEVLRRLLSRCLEGDDGSTNSGNGGRSLK